MIKKNCHIILFNLLCCFVLKAQYNTEFINYDNTKRSVSVNLDFDAGSNGISSSLSNKLIWGGYVDESIKEESSKHLKQLNNFGINLNYDVSTFIKGNNKFDFLIGFKNQEVLNASSTT